MIKLIFYRLLQGVFVLLIISLLVFVLLAAAGGDAVSVLDIPRNSDNAIIQIYDLDRPLMERYMRWVGKAARGNLGHSFTLHEPVWIIIWPRLARTVALAAVALLIAWSVSLTLGIAAARRAASWVDRLCSVIILLAASTPKLLLALLALALIAPTSLFNGAGPAMDPTEIWSIRVIPPAIVLSVPLMALFLAQTRTAVRAALSEEFVRAARAKGLPEGAILLRHALRPALNPLITIFGYSLGGVMSGSVIVEKVLGWPGLGELTVMAVGRRDIPLLLGVALVASAAVIAGNLVADVLQRLNNPQLRQKSVPLDEMA